MSLPVDPTAADWSPRAVLSELPSRSALERALRAADVRVDFDLGTDELLDQLSQVALHETAAQVRYAAPRTVHYYRIPRLGQLTASSFDSLAEESDGGFGGQVRATEELRERVYLVCSIPEGGTQAQLSVDESARKTTVATFDPGSDLLAVRAPTVEIADVTRNELLAHSELAESTRISFREESFRRTFESDVVEAYTQIVLGGFEAATNTDRIELTARARGSGREDLLADELVQSLLDRDDIERRKATARLELDSDAGEQTALSRSRVSVNFVEGTITFQRFVPEKTFVRVDRAVQSVMADFQ